MDADARNKKQLIPLVIYIVCILYITAFTRNPALVRTVKPIPFWSYVDWLKGNWSRGFSIALNIVLFVPLGYLLAKICKRKWFLPILISLFLTVAVEVIQYITYRGYFDVDDIISNTVGGVIGTFVFRWLGAKQIRKYAPLVITLAGFVGCLLTSGTKQIYETQFDFDVSTVAVENGKLTITGTCDIYRRDAVPYQILLEGMHASETVIDGERFQATLKPKNGELYVQFRGYQPIATSVFINGGSISYIPSNTPEPEASGTDLGFVVEIGTLKVCNAEYETYVYQVGNRLYWLIGKDFDASIIYHLYTTEPDKLPENRQPYGFDNRGFRIGSEKEITSTLNCGRYRVFTDIIPEEYYITAIAVGMNKGPDIYWREYFRPVR